MLLMNEKHLNIGRMKHSMAPHWLGSGPLLMAGFGEDALVFVAALPPCPHPPQNWTPLPSAWLTSGGTHMGLLLPCRRVGPVKGYSVETSTNKSKDEFPALNR